MTNDTLLLQHLSACIRAGGFAAEKQWNLYRAASVVAGRTWDQMTDDQRIRANDLFDDVQRLIDECLADGSANDQQH